MPGATEVPASRPCLIHLHLLPTPVVPLVVVRPGRLRKDTISCQSALLVELSINTYCPYFQIHSQSPSLRRSAFHFHKLPLLFHTCKETKSPSPSTSGHALRVVFIRRLLLILWLLTLLWFSLFSLGDPQSGQRQEERVMREPDRGKRETWETGGDRERGERARQLWGREMREKRIDKGRLREREREDAEREREERELKEYKWEERERERKNISREREERGE